jgi:hypothetical protein
MEEDRNRKPIGTHWLQAPFAAAAGHKGVAGGAHGLALPHPFGVLAGLTAVLAPVMAADDRTRASAARGGRTDRYSRGRRITVTLFSR